MNEPHPTALQRLQRHLAPLTTLPEVWYSLFADDAVVEFPYASGTPFPARLDGKPAVVAHYERAARRFTPFAMRARTLVVEARDGRIVRYREYWNPLLGMAVAP